MSYVFHVIFPRLYSSSRLLSFYFFFSILSWRRRTWGMGNGCFWHSREYVACALCYRFSSLVHANELIFAFLSRFCLTNSRNLYIRYYFFLLFLCFAGAAPEHTFTHSPAHNLNRQWSALYDYYCLVVIISADCAIHFIYKYIHTNEYEEDGGRNNREHTGKQVRRRRKNFPILAPATHSKSTLMEPFYRKIFVGSASGFH